MSLSFVARCATKLELIEVEQWQCALRTLTTVLIRATVVIAMALAFPSTALAGTYAWNLASDFTSTAPGANPDHDPYGDTPWRYENGSTLLSGFSTGIAGGLAGWQGGGGQPFVAINATGASIHSGSATYPPGQVALQPSSGAPAEVLWTSPLAGAVQVSGSISEDDPGHLLCFSSISWNLTNNGGPVVSGNGAGSFSRSIGVNPGTTIGVSVSNVPLFGNPACDSTGVALTITSPAGAPAVSLAAPGSGALITGGHQPTFSGSASNVFGASRTVTVRVYSGSSATGAPLQTLTATRSGTSYSIGPSAALPDGTYTAQVEQDDVASPPDAGFSAANTFQVFNGAPTITLGSLGAAPLLTSTPTFTGVAGAGAVVKLTVYPGAGTSGSAVGSVIAPVGSGGHFSARMGSPLADGQYTAIATQTGSGGATGFSLPMMFRIKVHGPAVTIDQPGDGAHTSDPSPFIAGTAGTALGDAGQVRVSMYAGGSASGQRLSMVTTPVGTGSWSLRWPTRLGLGLYTAQVTQTDDAGHTAAGSETFRIVPVPPEIGSAVTITRRGVASVAIACVSPGGADCTGDVLILTAKRFRAVPGGPSGPLRVMFAYLDIPSGSVAVARQPLLGDVLRTLRRARRVGVRVIVSFAHARPVSAIRTVRL